MKLQPQWALGALVVATGLYFVVGVYAPGSTMSVFSGDIGLKFIQIDNLSRGHAWLEYTGLSLDPTSRLYPFRPPFVFQQAERTYSVYLNPVIYFASVIYRHGGTWSCRLLPLACTLGLLVATYVLAVRIGCTRVSAAGAAAVLLVATPAWFYGWVFWEHAPAALLCLAATLVLGKAPSQESRQAPLFGGVLLGVATTCRPEAFLYLGATVVALRVVRRSLRAPAVLLGVALAVVLLLLVATPGLTLKEHVTQNFAGMAALSTAAAELLRARVMVLIRLAGGVLRPAPHQTPPFVAGGVTVGALIAIALGTQRRLKESLGSTITFVAVGLLAFVPTAFAWADGYTLLTGLLTACPLALWALAEGVVLVRHSVARPPERWELSNLRFIATTAVCYTISILLLAPNDGGNQWGPRYLLPVFPLLVCLLPSSEKAVGVRATSSPWWSRRTVVGVLIGMSAVAQVVGATNHIRIQREKSDALSRLATLPGKYVVTNMWFVPQEAALVSLRADKVLLLVNSRSDLEYAVTRLDQAGVSGFTFVDAVQPGFRPRRWGRYREQPAFQFIIHPFRLQASEFSLQASVPAGQ